MESQTASIAKHDCNLYSVYNNTDTYIKNECFKCNKILKFQWKSITKRIINLFLFKQNIYQRGASTRRITDTEN